MPHRTIAVVDGNSLLHRAFHALPPTMSAPDGRPTNAVYGFMSMLLKVVDDRAPRGVVVAFDRGKPAFRTEALATYKAHRPPTAEDLKVQFPMVKRLLDAMGVPVVEVEGWEGDDILGTIARKAEAAGMHALLVTGDRDALQLVRDAVSVVTARSGFGEMVVYDPEAVKERLGVTPAQVPDYLGLKGDASDNIPGVPGVGEKTAARLLAEYGTLDAVLAAAPLMKGRLGQNLVAHAEDARVSRTVATIACDVPFEIDLESVIWGAFDLSVVAEAFNELRFTSLLGRLDAAASTDESAGAKFPREPRASLAGGSAWDAAEGRDAADRVARWVGAPEWLGVALDDGTAESLFAVRRDVAIAHGGQVALLGADTDAEVLDALFRTGRVAAFDIKFLLHGLCRLSSAVGDGGLSTVGHERLFDCRIAAYLLESTRSDYRATSLATDFLGVSLEESSDARRRVMLEARAAAELAPVLAARLGDDGSDEVFTKIEMPLVPVLARMECAGVGLDTEVLSKLATEAASSLAIVRASIFAQAGVEFNVDSPKQLGEVLFEKLGIPPVKRTKTGYSTDASVLRGLAECYPIARMIMDYRELAKLMSTYLLALPRLVGEDGRVHTTFNQTVAATGRLSSSNPNLQNIPVRTDLGRRIRAAFVPAKPGHAMVVADYSQIELRILAHLSEDPGLIAAFTEGEDFHAATGARLFGAAPSDLPAHARTQAKAVNFGIVYGQSAHGLAHTLKVSHAQAQAMIDRYYAAYPKVREYLDATVAAARDSGYAATLFGRKRRIPELKSANHNMRSFGERTAMNHPMQGTAADIMKLAMIEVDRRLLAGGFLARMVLQVHDELVFEAPDDEVGALKDLVRESMADVVELRVPLEVSVAHGPDWASAK